MAEITTRLASTTDIARIAAIWTEQQAIESQLDPRLALVQREPLDWREAVVAGEGSERVVVAERAGQVVGFAYVVRQNDSGHLRAMGVDAHDGGGGVGTALLKAVSRWLLSLSVSHLIVDDVPRHIAVQHAFWRAKGASAVRETLYLPLRDED